jgi:hypothetical protein
MVYARCVEHCLEIGTQVEVMVGLSAPASKRYSASRAMFPSVYARSAEHRLETGANAGATERLILTNGLGLKG